MADNPSMLPLPSTKITFFATLTLTVLVIAACVYLFADIAQRSNQLAALEQDLQHELVRQEQKKVYREVAAQTAPQRALLDEFFLEEGDVVEFISLVELSASASGAVLEISNVEVVDAVENSNDKLEFLSLEFSAGGTWSELYKLSYLLEQIPLAVEIRNARFEQVAGSDPDRWRAVFELYALKEADE